MQPDVNEVRAYADQLEAAAQGHRQVLLLIGEHAVQGEDDEDHEGN